MRKAVSLTAEEVNLAWGLREDLTKLRESLRLSHSLLHDAEQRRVRSEAMGSWLEKLRNIAFDAEDVLDEIAYEGLRRKVELQNRMEKKVRDFFSRSNPIAFRFKMAHKVKKINVMLEPIMNLAAAIGLVEAISVAGTPQPSQDRVTVSFLDDSKVVGRQNQVLEIVEMLINSGNEDVLSVIPIVGMAGLGKTTIAKLVFNDDKLKGHFDAKIWVCVSENFEVDELLIKCQESLNPGNTATKNRDAMIRNLQKELGGKRYLLVLDDVWNTESAKWESLRTSLLHLNTAKGNKIIVTTRNDEVALIMGALRRPRLGELSEEDCWSIFEDRAFASGGPKMTSDLVEIGREIVKKCAGVPLAAKVTLHISYLIYFFNHFVTSVIASFSSFTSYSC